MPGRMQNDLPLSPALRVRVRLGGAVGVAEPQAAAAGGAVEGAVEGAVLPDGPLAAEPGLLLPAGGGQGRHPDDRGGEKRDAAHAYLPVTAGNSGGQFWMNPARLRRPATRFRSGRDGLG